MKHYLFLKLHDRNQRDPGKRFVCAQFAIDAREIQAEMVHGPVPGGGIDAIAAALMRLVAKRFNNALEDAYQLAPWARLFNVAEALERDVADSVTSVPIESVPWIDET
jgi:hypothetical protein